MITKSIMKKNNFKQSNCYHYSLWLSKKKLIISLLITLILGTIPLFAQSSQYPTEFDYKPRKIVPLLFFSSQFRGQDHMVGTEVIETFGFGGGLLYNINVDPFWRGHKFFYYYLDAEFQQLWNAGDVDTRLRPILALNPGIMVRSYIPFVKIFYGGGVSLRFGSNDFEPWGLYGQIGLEAYGVFFSGRLIGSPGEGTVHNEFRIGYMLVPGKKSWRR